MTIQGPQQLQQEYKTPLKPSSTTKPEQISEWIHEWEDSAEKLSLLGAPLTPSQTSCAEKDIYEAMPKQGQGKINAERRKGALVNHSTTRRWLLSLGTESMLSVAKGPAPLLLHNVQKRKLPSELKEVTNIVRKSGQPSSNQKLGSTSRMSIPFARSGRAPSLARQGQVIS